MAAPNPGFYLLPAPVHTCTIVRYPQAGYDEQNKPRFTYCINWPLGRKQILDDIAAEHSDFTLRYAYLPGANLIGNKATLFNLRNSDLSGAKLMRADLTRTDFREANLTAADLGGATLAKAKFGNANLTDANLTGANLAEANFRQANLTRANLTGANLTGAYFSGAILSNTILTGANLTKALLYGVDLRTTIGANVAGAFGVEAFGGFAADSDSSSDPTEDELPFIPSVDADASMEESND